MYVSHCTEKKPVRALAKVLGLSQREKCANTEFLLGRIFPYLD